MNWTFIILGTIVVLLIFILYNYTINKYLVQTAYLNTTNPPVKISASNMPYSQSFTISGWFYMNDNNITPGTKYYLFSRQNYAGIYVINANNKLSLMLSRSNNSNDMAIIDTVQINEWMCITVSVYNNILDVYINGQLAQSLSNSTQNQSQYGTLSNVVGVGTDASLTQSPPFNAVLSNLAYHPVYYSPKDAMSSYVNSKQSTIRDMLMKNTVGISIFKNGVLAERQTIL